MKLVFVIRTLPFAVLDFIAGLHSMNMDKMFPNSPNMPMIGITTPRITNVRTDPEIYDIFSQKFLKIFINLIYYLICLPSLLIIADTSLVAKNPQDLFNLAVSEFDSTKQMPLIISMIKIKLCLSAMS